MKLHITNKQLRHALDCWLVDYFLRYGSEYRVRSVALKPAGAKRRVVLSLYRRPKPKAVQP